MTVPANSVTSAARRPKRTAGQWLVLLGVAGATLAVCAVPYSAPFRDWRYGRMDAAQLAQIQEQRLNDPIFLYYFGRRLNERGQFGEALPALERAVGMEKNSARLRDEWAKAQMGSGQVTAAFGQLKEYVAAEPSAAAPAFLLGKFYVTQQAFAPARQELEKATQRDSQNGEAWSLLAHCRIKMGDYGGAMDALTKAVALDPKNHEAHLQLGVLNAAKNPQEAERAFSAAAALAPKNAVIHREYSRFLLARGKAEQAEKEARLAVEQDTSDPFAHLLLGRCLLELRRPKEALPSLLTAASLAPSDPNPAESLRRAYRQVSDNVNADLWAKRLAILRENSETRRKWEQETLAHPENRQAHEMYASYLCKAGEVNSCARQFALALKAHPDSPRVLIATARSLNEGGLAAEALPIIRKARALTPTNPEGYEVLGDTLVSLGRLHEAALSYNQIRDWHKERMPIYQQKIAARAAQLAQSRDPAEVALREAEIAPDAATTERLLNAALTADRDNTRALRGLLRLQVGQGRGKEANETAKRLIALAPEDGLGHALFALLFLQETKSRSLTEAEAEAVGRHLHIAEADSSVAGTVSYTQGLLALRLGKHQQAVESLDRAQKLDPDAVAVYPPLAEARKAMGDLSGAERALNEFRRRTSRRTKN